MESVGGVLVSQRRVNDRFHLHVLPPPVLSTLMAFAILAHMVPTVYIDEKEELRPYNVVSIPNTRTLGCV